MLEFAEEPLHEVAFFVEGFAETGLPFAVGFGGDVGDGTLFFDQVADAVGVICLVAKDDGAGLKTVEQPVCGWGVMGLSRRQAEADR